METTWTPCKWFMDGLEGKQLADVSWYKDATPQIIRCYKWLFRPAEFALLPPPEPDED